MNAIAQILARTVVERVVARASREIGQPLPPAMKHELEREAATAIERDPQIRNEMNAEKPYQSRVAMGAVVAAAGVLVPIVGPWLGFEITQERFMEVTGAIVTVFGALYTLYGRFASFSAPLFERWSP